ncbi:hypothetical protein AF335_18920 [Streptomyces eurocidicus]|uniref:Nucleoside-diphosphate-sugar epimerase n=1 Tax=Streptomyces eurocidicus TaxID=66423 RepID=A0A2N8NV04_STREU|nr:SDR family oxidoreductase [Streptomyces eurocidicus]MBB5122434.1 nucleoside-diphosphate-sugar epimerase [Streptomyces eurocidicus]MBF6052159.1 NAD-dependent epimerase/dehydratase family protein [Streptomyces eurocidicus]PNE32608.1 hypothetical protein AF335_18920 [Streptomyces eurocidicus]
MSKPTLLLTGATGVLGRAFVEELAEDHRVIALRHRAPVDDPRVTELQGTLDDPLLGLGAEGFHDLARRVDLVLHSGARTAWNTSRETLFAANTTGTAHMLGFAEAAGAPFYYVSTAFVARPQEEERTASGPGAYVASKIAAERLVRESGLAAAIVRPSVVGGDSRTGRIAAFQGMHQVIAGCVHGTIPVVPAAPGSPFDHIPQDLVARGVGKLLRDGVTSGEYWLTGGPASPTVGEHIDAILRVAGRFGHRPPPPRLMPAEAVNRLLLPMMQDVIPRSLRRRFAGFEDLMLLFQSSARLESSFGALGMADELTHDALLGSFEKSVAYWIATKAPAVESAA